ncbi:MAG: beta-ketoacyl-ACP synthase II [Erysipelotrichaceae bacterium]
MKRRVVITGMGCVTPIGHDCQTSWDNLIAGVNGIAPITGFDTQDYKVKLAAEIKELDLHSHFSKSEVKNNDRFNLLTQIAGREAVKEANLNEDINRDRMGVVVTSGIGGIQTIDEMSRTLERDGTRRVSPYFIPKALINLAAGAIAIEHQANGICTSHVTACAAGANCIGEAFQKIRDGYEDVIIAGAGEAAITPLGIAGFQAMHALHVGDDPTRASIPFDAKRSGFVMGEGAGVVVLETLDGALARNATILAEVVGYGATCDANHITAPMSGGEQAAKAMQRALEDAQIAPTAIGYINAHGTSTSLNDKTETAAMKRVFQEHASQLVISSTKSSTGHLLGASGAVEAIFTIKALQSGLLPATLHHLEADPECDLDYNTKGVREQVCQYAMSNSFGFGGHNVSLVFKRWEG